MVYHLMSHCDCQLELEPINWT